MVLVPGPQAMALYRSSFEAFGLASLKTDRTKPFRVSVPLDQTMLLSFDPLNAIRPSVGLVQVMPSLLYA
jgi:hypothetical protein